MMLPSTAWKGALIAVHPVTDHFLPPLTDCVAYLVLIIVINSFIEVVRYLLTLICQMFSFLLGRVTLKIRCINSVQPTGLKRLVKTGFNLVIRLLAAR